MAATPPRPKASKFNADRFAGSFGGICGKWKEFFDLGGNERKEWDICLENFPRIAETCTECWVAGFGGNNTCGIVFSFLRILRLLVVFFGLFPLVGFWWFFWSFSPGGFLGFFGKFPILPKRTVRNGFERIFLLGVHA